MTVSYEQPATHVPASRRRGPWSTRPWTSPPRSRRPSQRKARRAKRFLHSGVAVVDLAEQAVHVMNLEQGRDDRVESLGRQPQALTLRRERDAHLCRRRLVRPSADGAVAPASSPLARSTAATCTHAPGVPDATSACAASSASASVIAYVGSHDWYRATSGCDRYATNARRSSACSGPSRRRLVAVISITGGGSLEDGRWLEPLDDRIDPERKLPHDLRDCHDRLRRAASRGITSSTTASPVMSDKRPSDEPQHRQASRHQAGPVPRVAMDQPVPDADDEAGTEDERPVADRNERFRVVEHQRRRPRRGSAGAT